MPEFYFIKIGERIRKYIDIPCKECNTICKKRQDQLKIWKGCCVSCTQKQVTNLPERKELTRKNARIQVLKQGGIPNAKPFGIRDTRGVNHYNWQGGITPLRVAIWQSKEYQNWRNSVFQRDNYKCVACGINDHKLEADHIKSFSLYPELRFDIDNGRTLCKKCHKEYGTWANRGIEYKPASFDYV